MHKIKNYQQIYYILNKDYISERNSKDYFENKETDKVIIKVGNEYIQKMPIRRKGRIGFSCLDYLKTPDKKEAKQYNFYYGKKIVRLFEKENIQASIILVKGENKTC